MRAPGRQESLNLLGLLGVVIGSKASPFGSSEAIVNDGDCRGQSYYSTLASVARLRGRIRSGDYTPGNSVARRSKARPTGELSGEERARLRGENHPIDLYKVTV